MTKPTNGLWTARVLVLGDQASFYRPLDLLADRELQAIRSKGFLRVVVNSYTPRLALLNPTTQVIEGFEIDLLRHFERQLFGIGDGSHLQLVEPELADRVDLLREHEVDLVVANMSVTDARRKLVDFSGYYHSPVAAPLIAEISRT